MPLYTVSTMDAIDAEKRQEVSNVIMDTHCGITGAPETFVNVVFWQNVPLRPQYKANLVCAVRKGRTGEMNNTLQNEIRSNVSKALGFKTMELELVLHEVPAQWVMEGGEVLPEPGEEAFCEWLQKGHG